MPVAPHVGAFANVMFCVSVIMLLVWDVCLQNERWVLGPFLAHFCVARMHARSHSVRFGRFCKCDGNAGSKRKRADMSKVSGVGEAGNPHA